MDGTSFQHATYSQTPYAQAELELALTDSNGIVTTGLEDIDGSLNGYLTLNREHLSQWLRQYQGRAFGAPPWFSVMLTDVFYDECGFYVLRCQIQLLKKTAWTDVEIQLSISEEGHLVLSLRRHRLPAILLLNAMQSLLDQLVETRINRYISYLKLGLNIKRHGRYLYIRPHLREIVVPVRAGNYLQFSGLEKIYCVFRRDAERNLQMVFDKVQFVTSSDPKGQRGVSWEQGDMLKLKMALQAMPDGQVSFSAQGQLEIHLNEAETARIHAGGHRLSEVLERLHLHADINSQVEINPAREVQIQAHNTWYFKDVQILGKTYQIQPTDVQISFDQHQGLQLEIQTGQPTIGSYTPQLTENALRLHLDGPAYLEAMIRAIGSARRWVDLESFLYFPGHTTRRITRALALKAAGLRERHGQLESDPRSPKGVPVFVLFSNLELIPEQSEPILAMFREEILRLNREIQHLHLSHRQQRQTKKHLGRNLQYYSYVEGIPRADHRKLLLIDGHTAFVGGINLGDKFLAPDSFHDVMVQFIGPGVIKAQQAFMENWWRVTRQNNHPAVRKRHGLQRKAHKAAHRWQVALSPSEVVLTDARQTETAGAIRQLIENAQKRIWIEHAYFYHPETLRSLLRALERGVEILIIIPDVSNIEIFNPTNTEAVRQLMLHQQQTGKGKVEAYLYTGRPGEFSRMAHTKVITVDGRYCLVGSANLTLRSMQSPFKEVLTGDQNEHILFNQEIGLYIDDPSFIRRFERALFVQDIQHRCLKLSYPDVLKRLENLGGTSALQKAELGARLA